LRCYNFHEKVPPHQSLGAPFWIKTGEEGSK
jgi:hypothetical protein